MDVDWGMHKRSSGFGVILVTVRMTFGGMP